AWEDARRGGSLRQSPGLGGRLPRDAFDERTILAILLALLVVVVLALLRIVLVGLALLGVVIVVVPAPLRIAIVVGLAPPGVMVVVVVRPLLRIPRIPIIVVIGALLRVLAVGGLVGIVVRRLARGVGVPGVLGLRPALCALLDRVDHLLEGALELAAQLHDDALELAGEAADAEVAGEEVDHEDDDLDEGALDAGRDAGGVASDRSAGRGDQGLDQREDEGRVGDDPEQDAEDRL